MKTVLLSLLTVLCTLVFAGFSRLDFFDNDDFDITWEEIDDDLWP
ncbi:hypothetical protein ACFPMF_19745 [Larkinella bovis]|uniref:Uncharacterized protein n=1 Tax=Larkinella bovis TaxID=683041 RepID=A0ABW0IE55_9BACT